MSVLRRQLPDSGLRLLCHAPELLHLFVVPLTPLTVPVLILFDLLLQRGALVLVPAEDLHYRVWDTGYRPLSLTDGSGSERVHDGCTCQSQSEDQ